MLRFREAGYMTVGRIAEILEAKIAVGEEQRDLELSAVMAFVKERVVLLLACGRLYEGGLRSGGIREIS